MRRMRNASNTEGIPNSSRHQSAPATSAEPATLSVAAAPNSKPMGPTSRGSTSRVPKSSNPTGARVTVAMAAHIRRSYVPRRSAIAPTSRASPVRKPAGATPWAASTTVPIGATRAPASTTITTPEMAFTGTSCRTMSAQSVQCTSATPRTPRGASASAAGTRAAGRSPIATGASRPESCSTHDAARIDKMTSEAPHSPRQPDVNPSTRSATVTSSATLAPVDPRPPTSYQPADAPCDTRSRSISTRAPIPRPAHRKPPKMPIATVCAVPSSRSTSDVGSYHSAREIIATTMICGRAITRP